MQKKKKKKNSWFSQLWNGAHFDHFAKNISEIMGNPLAFVVAGLFVLGWLSTGFFLQFSNTWQLVVNTITNVAQFLILFLIQNTQNRNASDFQIKLDELLRANKTAHNSVIDLDKLSHKQLQQLEKKYKELSESDDNLKDK